MLTLLLAVACTPGSGVPVLGDGAHDLDAVLARTIEDVPGPQDLAFHPDVPDMIWALGPGQDAMVLISDARTAPTMELRGGPEAGHFLARPSALAFGAPGLLATAQHTRARTQPTTPGKFMGPTLWQSDPALFDGGVASHMDMLHNSPDSAGIAWDHDNVYWIFDGFHSAITRYDFVSDHGPAGTDHSDGVVARYVEGEVAGDRDVASHLALHDGLLYIADTANQRVAVLDTTTGERGADIQPNFDGGEQYAMRDAVISTVVEGFESPSGVEVHDDVLYVTDRATGRISAFDLNGQLLDYVDLEEGSAPGGLTFADDGHLWVADEANDRLIELAPPGE